MVSKKSLRLGLWLAGPNTTTVILLERFAERGGRLARELGDEESAHTGNSDPHDRAGDAVLLSERLELLRSKRFEHLQALSIVDRHSGDNHLLKEGNAVEWVGAALVEQTEHHQQTFFERAQRKAEELATLLVLHATMLDWQRAVSANAELVLRCKFVGQHCHRDEREKVAQVQCQAGAVDQLHEVVGLFLADVLLRDLLAKEQLALLAGVDALLLGTLNEEEAVLGAQSGKEMALRTTRKRNGCHELLQSKHSHQPWCAP